MFRIMKGTRTRVALVTCLLIGGAVAYAYWTSGGTGSGTASTGNTVAITVNQTSTPSGLYPGGPAQALSGNFNNTNSGAIFVTSVNASISSVTGPNITGGTPCDASDYALSGFPIVIGRQVAAGSGVDSWTGGTVALVNKPAANQNGCKGATVNIAYTSN
jgi:hypothetical protein